MVNRAYSIDSPERKYPADRLARTEARFITAAVEAYCPYDQSKIASIMANPAPASNESTHRVAAHMHNAVNSGSDLREPPPALDMINMSAAWQQPTGIGAVRLPHLMEGVFALGRYGGNRSDCDAHGPALASLIGAAPSGEITDPNPPQLPAPPPPAAQIRTPHRPIAAPPPPKHLPPPPQQPPPPPQQPPPPPQQPPPPAVAPPLRGALPAVAAVAATAVAAVAATAVVALAAAAVATQRSRRQSHPCRRALSRSRRDYPARLLAKRTAVIGTAVRTTVCSSLQLLSRQPSRRRPFVRHHRLARSPAGAT